MRWLLTNIVVMLIVIRDGALAARSRLLTNIDSLLMKLVIARDALAASY